MKATQYGPRVRQRSWRALSISLCLLLALSSTADGVRYASYAAYYGAVGMFQELPPDYVDTPEAPPDLGMTLSRDETTQNGVWTSEGRSTLYELEQQALYDFNNFPSGLPTFCPENVPPQPPDAEEQHPSKSSAPIRRTEEPSDASEANEGAPAQGVGTIGGGTPFPWEASFPGGGSNSIDSVVNSNTGNRQTIVPLLSIPIRGGMSMGITLYHSSKANHWTAFGSKWSSNLDAELLTNHTDGEISSNNHIILRWGDGQLVQLPYDSTTNKYKAPDGLYYSITRDGNTGFPEWTLTVKSGTKYVFKMPRPGASRSGLLAHIEDRAGNRITITRQPNERQILYVTDPVGRRFSFAYLDGRVKEIKDCRESTNRSWKFAYTGGTLTTLTYPLLAGNTYTRQFSYTNGNITSETDRRGKLWSCSYDSSNRQTGYMEPVGVIPYTGYTIAYASSLTTMTDPNNNTERHQYSLGRIQTTYDRGGFPTTYAYDSDRRVASVYDEDNKEWKFGYDSRGNMLWSRTPLGVYKYATYNIDNTVATTYNAVTPSTVVHAYSDGKWVNSVRQHGGLGVSYPIASANYDSGGRATSVTSYGQVTGTYTLSYDSFGLMQTVTDPRGQVWRSTHSALGWTTSLKDPLLNNTQTTFDDWARPIVITKPGGAFIQIQYDSEDNVVQLTDERGKASSWQYNDVGWTTHSTNALGHTTMYGHGKTGFVASVTNGRGFTRTYLPTKRYEVKMLIMPDGSQEFWQFRNTGQVATYTPAFHDSSQRFTISYSFDHDGRPKTISYGDGGYTPDVSYVYGNQGHTVTVTDGSGACTWTYNGFGDLLSLVTPQGTLNYTCHSGSGLRTSMTEVGQVSRVTSYEYDNMNRLKKLINPASEVTEWVYDNVGRMSKRLLGNGTCEEVSYDARSRPIAIVLKNASTAVLRSHVYSYDSASNIISQAVDGLTTTFGYDNLNQLLSEAKPGFSCAYTYDASGNRLSRNLNGMLEAYNVDSADKLVSITWNGGFKSFTYDALGRRVSMSESGEVTNYSWDRESRLKAVATPGTAVNTFTYNAYDARVSKVDSLGTSTYKRNGVHVTSPVLADGFGIYTPGVSETRGGVTRWLHSGIKNIESLTSSTQILSTTRQYDAFGNLIGGGIWYGPFGYAGGYGYQEDADTGLKLLGHRVYDSETGRFLTRDPISHGPNAYAYCNNNPLHSHDESGLCGGCINGQVPALLAEGAAAEAVPVVGAGADIAVGAASTAIGAEATLNGVAVTARVAVLLTRLDQASMKFLLALPPTMLKAILTLFDLFEQEAATAAFGPAGGSRAHAAVSTAAKGLDFGDVSVAFEKSFKPGSRGTEMTYGQKGSVRGDVVVGLNSMKVMFDWKFGRAVLSEPRRKALEGASGLPTIGIPAGKKVFYGGVRRGN